MHDPLSLLFHVRIPVPFMGKIRKKSYGSRGYLDLAEVWHEDPCKNGNDDSCGYFLRAHHGNPEILAKIKRRFENDWDNTYTSEAGHGTISRGYFCPNGEPNLSVMAIGLNLFFCAACVVFDGRDGAMRYMKKHLMDILFFAENPFDSMRDTILDTFGELCREKYTPQRRKERISHLASMIYGQILRDTKPWWKSRNLHVHHWRVKIPLWQYFRRWAFQRCCECHGSLGWKKSVVSDWSGKQLTCWKCSQTQCAVSQKATG